MCALPSVSIFFFFAMIVYHFLVITGYFSNTDFYRLKSTDYCLMFNCRMDFFYFSLLG